MPNTPTILLRTDLSPNSLTHTKKSLNDKLSNYKYQLYKPLELEVICSYASTAIVSTQLKDFVKYLFFESVVAPERVTNENADTDIR